MYQYRLQKKNDGMLKRDDSGEMLEIIYYSISRF